MKKRIGNDFIFYWIIKENNIVINPDDVLDFKIIIRHRRTGSEIVAEFDVVNSSPSIKCENLLYLGIYDLIATWKTIDYSFNDGFRNSSADVQGFEIVSSSSSECETDLTVTSEIAIGFEGADAFEVWLKNGNEGKTYEDYIAFLQKPATDAAALVDVAIENANEAAAAANESALLVQDSADNADAKAILANNAAILATEKASLADSKATLANDKAILAQSAADNANAKAAEVTAAVLSAGSLGSIKPTDAAPTPARNGNYTFSIGGNKPAWLTAEAGVIAVKAGDGVSVVYTAPSSYTYTHVEVNSVEEIPNVIDMQPGQYLSDVVKTITGATLENPVTINFYNHSKTVNWATFTEKIHWPQHVYLNFVGEINWWPDYFYEGIEFDNLFETNPTDKLLIGFSFNKTNPESHKFISGLPQNLSKVFFGGLDELVEVAVDYDDMTDVDSHYGQGTLGLVFCGGDVLDNVNNNKLYKRIGDTFYDVSVDFSYVDLSAHYLKNAFLCGVDLTGADLSGVNLQGVNWQNVVSVENCNFKGADLSRGFNLPSEIDTRDKFIMVAGVNNVDANTTWIDGLSIIVDSLSGLVDANY